jgi:hypothetical protein
VIKQTPYSREINSVLGVLKEGGITSDTSYFCIGIKPMLRQEFRETKQCRHAQGTVHD